MNKRVYVIAMLLCLALLISSCKSRGASSGSAPRTPFIGGTGGITMNFEKGSPPPEVTDDTSFPFSVILRLKNDGEARVDRKDIRLNLVGFDPSDFGRVFDDLRDVQTEGTLESKKRDAEGNIVEGTTSFAKFPKSAGDFIPSKFSGNTELTFRADACYHYQTDSNTKLCILRDMININDGSLCKPDGARTIYSSAAPVQVQNFKQNVIGKDKISFSFDVVLSGNVDIFWSKDETKPSSGFYAACPTDPSTRRAVENRVGIEITEIPEDPIFQKLQCGGLDTPSSSEGVVILVNGRRTITCTAELVTDRVDLEKVTGIKVKYNVLDNKETKVLIKHLAEAP